MTLTYIYNALENYGLRGNALDIAMKDIEDWGKAQYELGYGDACDEYK